MKYVLASRRLASTDARAEAARAMDRVFWKHLGGSCKILGDTRAEGPFARHVRVFEADPAEVDEKRSEFPETVLIEAAIEHSPAAVVRFRIEGRGHSLAGARVIAFVRGEDQTIVRVGALSDEEGRIEIVLEEGSTLDTVAVRPFGGFWSRVIPEPSADSAIVCEPLPAGPTAWWHDLLNVEPDPSLGAGIKVGVIDTGVGPHPCLKHADFGLFLDGGGPTLPGLDEDGHGTHVAGLIGGAACANGAYSGVAPGVTLASARVCGKSSKAHQGDIANALDALSGGFEADLVNLSLAAARPSQILHEALLDALDRGTLCICAAGNSGGAIEYPAALAESVAVAAVGKLGWGARGSLATLHLPPAAETLRHGRDGLYSAVFSCHGDQIFCAAPGVGIISTIPSEAGAALYAEMDGTSMASPLACGTLAAALATDPSFGSLPRDRSRADRARAVLRESCRTGGLGRLYEGHGIPSLP